MCLCTSALFWISLVALFSRSGCYEVCLNQILDHIKEKHMLVVYPEKTDILENVLKMDVASVSLNINNPFDFKSLKWRPNVYIITVEDIREYTVILRRLHGTSIWNPRAKFLIIYQGDEDLNNFLRLSLKFMTLKLFVFVPSKKKILSFFPFENGSCLSDAKLEPVYHCRTAENITSVFSYEFPDYFSGCTVKVITAAIVPYVIDVQDPVNPGFEIVMLRELAARINVTLEFVGNKQSSHLTLDNNIFDHVHNVLLNGEADIAVGMMMYNKSVINLFDNSFSYCTDESGFFVPSAMPIEYWQYYKLIFSNNVWMLYFATFFIISLTLWLVGSTRINSENCENYQYCILTVVSIVFSSCSRKLRSPFLKFVFALCIFASLVMNGIYQNKLTSFLTKPLYERPMKTISDVGNSSLLYGGNPVYYNILKTEHSEFFLATKDRWITCPFGTPCLSRAAEKRDMSVIKNVKTTAYYISRLYTFPNGQSKLVHVEGIVLKYFVQLAYFKGHPCRKRIDVFIHRMLDSGLISQWIDDVQQTRKYVVYDEFVPISFQRIRFALFILLTGNVIACFVFLFELMIY